MSHPLLAGVQGFIQQEKLFPAGAKLIVAVSGGLDSVVLLTVLRQLGYDLRVAHFNYKLRGSESDGDAYFVRQLAQKLNIPFDYRSSKANERRALEQGNLQATARQLRYDWLAELKATHGIEYICTAHHLDDNLETLFLQLSRGTAFTGLTGMQPRLENGVCRPFLNTPRSLIEDYARSQQITWREDRSNATNDYLRNQIRHQISPSFLSLQPDAQQRLATTFERLRSEEKLFLVGLDLLWQRALVAPDTIDRKKLPQDRAAAIRLLHHQLRPYGFKGDQFRQLLEAGSGTLIEGKTGSVKVKKQLLLLELYSIT